MAARHGAHPHNAEETRRGRRGCGSFLHREVASSAGFRLCFRYRCQEVFLLVRPPKGGAVARSAIAGRRVACEQRRDSDRFRRGIGVVPMNRVKPL